MDCSNCKKRDRCTELCEQAEAYVNRDQKAQREAIFASGPVRKRRNCDEGQNGDDERGNDIVDILNLAHDTRPMDDTRGMRPASTSAYDWATSWPEDQNEIDLLGFLTDDQRKALHYARNFGLTTKQIAQRMRVPAGQVALLIQGAQRKIRLRMEKGVIPETGLYYLALNPNKRKNGQLDEYSEEIKETSRLLQNIGEGVTTTCSLFFGEDDSVSPKPNTPKQSKVTTKRRRKGERE